MFWFRVVFYGVLRMEVEVYMFGIWIPVGRLRILPRKSWPNQ